MVVVYSSQISPRLKFILKQIFEHMLGAELQITNVLEEFIAHNGPKLNYSKTQFSSEFFIRSNNLLFEQGINDIDIQVTNWDDLPIFFPTGKKSALPFDIFAASFYLITRYEEYLPQLRDQFNRYPFQESLAYQNKFLERPLIDLWVSRFKAIFHEKFPDYKFKEGSTVVQSTVNVDLAFKYLKKGAVRTLAGYLRDLFQFKFAELYYRTVVLMYVKKDPYDTFDNFIAYQRRFKVPTTFFYLIAPYSSFDKNISFTKLTYKELVKSNSDYTDLGLLASFYTMENDEEYLRQKNQLEEATHWEITKSKQYYSRIKLPEVYQSLVDASIEEDFSMGYEEAIGFRASTCTPFYFYDLDFEIQTPLKINPYYFSDRYFIKRRMSPRMAYEKIIHLYKLVKPLGGYFPLNFHSDTLSNNEGKQSWKRIYEELMNFFQKEMN